MRGTGYGSEEPLMRTVGGISVWRSDSVNESEQGYCKGRRTSFGGFQAYSQGLRICPIPRHMTFTTPNST